jgi:hypothetical protein
MAFTKLCKFTSKYKNLRIVVKPTRITKEGNVSSLVNGKCIEFKDYQFETTERELVDFLRKHRLYGTVVIEEKVTDME